MTSTPNVSLAEPSLAEQRRILRQRLQAQRRLIAHLEYTPDTNNTFPHSMTMRLLMRRSTFTAIQLLLEWAALRKTKK